MELYRKEQNKWVYYIFGPEDELELSSVSLHFPVAEAYVNVNFANENSPEADVAQPTAFANNPVWETKTS